MVDITPSNEQNQAIKEVVSWYGDDSRQEFYVSGYAGTGKSTIVDFAVKEINAGTVYTAAYTGKAASVLRDKGNANATTIHNMIYRPKVDKKTGEVQFRIQHDNLAKGADLVILDECSMIDEKIAADIRKFAKKILVIGDPGQLPPVNGEGAFNKNLPDVFLEEIHRQLADSPILELATLARQGKPMPVGYEKGSVKVLPLNKETQHLIYNPETQVICGKNNVRWTYTQRIRTQLGFGGYEPMPNEKIICCKNNHGLGIFNGNMGTLKNVKPIEKNDHKFYRFDVQMEGMEFATTDLLVDPYHFGNHFSGGKGEKIYIKKMPIEQFDWGYVITCHKAQGSSWNHVTIIDDSGAFRENSAKWLYTAITRAETGLTLLVRE